ncbi:small polypeptide DEVIL 11 [Cicer arietinum]|uniref:Uncharacterized protein LOC113785391 n=1 Tax=Cicer arietinum TaxID=3827 RepID=A0A3Q7YCI0_CICAR|nr:uncharacterized protein LOC113785391 [Cicer arietinum]
MAYSSSMESAQTQNQPQPQPPLYFDEKWKLSKKEGSTRSKSSTTPFIKSNSTSQRKCAFARKCARLVKEQRARFYIMRRCVTMLICWRDYSDS